VNQGEENVNQGEENVNSNFWDLIGVSVLILSVVGSLVLIDVNCQYQNRANKATGVTSR
jgi:hypothetical protein